MRLFLGEGADLFQFLTVSQNPSDASIYFSAPKFQNVCWNVLAQGPEGQPVMATYRVAEEGKLSVHGSGTVHAKPHGAKGTNEFAIRGNVLKSADGAVLSVRHLLTILPAQPNHKPSSPAGSRKSDGWITATPLEPMVLILWAVPRHGLTVEVSFSLHIDDLEETPPKAGWGAFDLETHALVFFAYRTKHMKRWPKDTLAWYTDGHVVPTLVGTGTGEALIEYVQPTYKLEDKKLTIAVGRLNRMRPD